MNTTDYVAHVNVPPPPPSIKTPNTTPRGINPFRTPTSALKTPPLMTVATGCTSLPPLDMFGGLGQPALPPPLIKTDHILSLYNARYESPQMATATATATATSVLSPSAIHAIRNAASTLPDQVYVLKVVVVGDTNTGKSTLLREYLNRNAGDQNKNLGPTIGVDFMYKHMRSNNKDVKIHFWDTSGLLSHRGVIGSFLREYCGAVLVYDVTNRASFDNLRIWLHMLKDASKCRLLRGEQEHQHPMLLIGNKCDLISARDLHGGSSTPGFWRDPKNKREVSSEEASAFAIENSMQFFEISSRTEYAGLEYAMTSFINTLCSIYLSGATMYLLPDTRTGLHQGPVISAYHACAGLRVENNDPGNVGTRCCGPTPATPTPTPTPKKARKASHRGDTLSHMDYVEYSNSNSNSPYPLDDTQPHCCCISLSTSSSSIPPASSPSPSLSPTGSGSGWRCAIL